MAGKKTCLGLVVGNRGFFPDDLARKGHSDMTSRLKALGYNVVVLDKKTSKFGCVETWREAKECAALFRRHADEIDGIVVTLPNFGDERAVADTIKLARLDVPVLIHAWPDAGKSMGIDHRRDAFCGKISVCNNLVQYATPFSLTDRHTVDPDSDEFAREIEWFAAVCRVVKGVRRCRIGALGARPAPFNTTRYSEKLLQEAGVTVETLDLSEVFAAMDKLEDGDRKVQGAVRRVGNHVDTNDAPKGSLVKMGKLAVTLEQWMSDAELDALAIQCWTSLEENMGIVPCTVMSMFSESLRPAACEVDVTGALAMFSLVLAAQQPAFIVDWNNNYGDDPDKCVMFHCSNFPKSCFPECRMGTQDILADAVGKENSWGTVTGRVRPGPMTFARITTWDDEGTIGAYVGEGEFTEDPVNTFGGYGVAHIPGLQPLLQYICENGFEHHVAVNYGKAGRALFEAFDKYLGWDVYRHQG